MRTKDKLAKEDGKHIYCYKQGAFWVCYEQSAYIVNLSKGYKPNKKLTLYKNLQLKNNTYLLK